MKNKFLIFLLLAVSIACGFFVWKSIKMQQNLSVAEANYRALTEEMRVITMKNGDLLASRQSYVASINELNNYIDIDKKEIKRLQRELDGKVSYISQLEGQISIIPTHSHDTTVVYKDSTFSYTFKFSDEWYNLTGSSVVDYNRAKTEINNLYVNVPLKVGLTDDWRIFVTTPNPYVSINSLEGAVLDKSMYNKTMREKRWGFGVSVGVYGGYNIINKKMYLGPGGGLSFSYNF